MNLMEAVPVLISGVFPLAMTHGVVVKSPFCQPMVDMVFIGMNPGARGDEPLDQGANRGLLDVPQHPDHHRPAPGGPFFDGIRMPSFMTRHDVHLVAFHLAHLAWFRLAGDDPGS